MINVRFVWIAVAFAAVAGCGGEQIPPIPDDPAGLQTPHPPSGWSIADGPTVYDGESLFEYLNGGAPLYLDYGFAGLTQIRYQMGDDPFASVTLDIYDMGSVLGAFGVFRSSVPPGVEVENWGVEGYRSGTIAAAWLGPVYVHGEADDDRPELVGVLDQLVSSAIAAVEGQDRLPSELDVLPGEGLVPGSERYFASDLFGHAFLPGGFAAKYEVDNREMELFFTELPGPSEASDAVGRLRAHENEWGEVGAEITGLGDGGFRFTDPGLGPGLVVRSGKFIAGAHGTSNADPYVRELLVSLPHD